MKVTGEAKARPTYDLFSALALVSLGGLLAFLLADRILFHQVIGGSDQYMSRMSLLFVPIMIGSAGALVIFRTSFTALERQLQERETTRQEHMAELERTYQSILFALVAALDTRDHHASGHSHRVVGYALTIADRLGLSEVEKRDLLFGAYLHDVGKIALDDTLLRKKSNLSESEWAEMRRHPVIGHEILQGVKFLNGAFAIVHYHHEHYDGSGYPAGLSGTEIPLLARVFAVADAFDAMSVDRPYRRAMSSDAALAVIAEQVGKQFCPRCARAFLALTDAELAEIRQMAEQGLQERFWANTHWGA